MSIVEEGICCFIEIKFTFTVGLFLFLAFTITQHFSTDVKTASYIEIMLKSIKICSGKNYKQSVTCSGVTDGEQGRRASPLTS